MRIRWRRRRPAVAEPRKGPELDTGDDAIRALDRAHVSLVEARGHLDEAQQHTREFRRELLVNHLAEDVYATMRRKRP